ncbi:MAG: ABC transporter ATP-binding protein [Candidatus Hodarchaeales archaeon]
MRKVFSVNEQEIIALADIDFKVNKGEYRILMGPSGSGKTTLLNLIGTLDVPTKGKVLFHGEKLDPMKINRLRNETIGFVFQTYYLLNQFSAIKNVMIPLILRGLSRKICQEAAKESLIKVGLDERMKHRPHQLSGGEQQRVCIAREIVKHYPYITPDFILLCDEPTANLDTKTGARISDLLLELNKDLGITVINATHNIKMVSGSDTIAWIKDGKIKHITTADPVVLTAEELKETSEQTSTTG